jgi:hypothetical protein
MKPLSQMTATEVTRVAASPVHDRCERIVGEFAEWLAVHVLRYKLKHEDLPQLNDAFRAYFAGTRSASGRQP